MRKLLPHDAPRWVAWTTKKRNGKTIKTPIDFMSGAPINVYAKRDFWTRDQLPPTMQPGFVLGSVPGDRDHFIGLDLDTCRDPKTGVLTDWATETIEAFGSYAEVSPSGTGVKCFARVDPIEFANLRNGHMERRLRRTWNAGAGEHPPGIMLAIGGYFTVTGQALDGTPGVRKVSLSQVQKVADIGARIERKAREAGSLKAEHDSGWRDESGSGASWRLAIEMRRTGEDFDDYIDALLQNPEALRACEESSRGFDAQAERDWERAGVKVQEEHEAPVTKLKDFTETEDAAAVDSNSAAEAEEFEGLNQKHAVVFIKGGTYIAHFKGDRIDFGSSAALHQWYANQRVKVSEDDKTVPVSAIWVTSPGRRQYPNGVVFAPGTKSDRVDGALNLWRGWGVEPKRNASCDLILAHIRDVISGGEEALFNYNVLYDAEMVQNPKRKPGVARVLRSREEGVGKDTYGKLITRIVGARHTAHIGESERLVARFNSQFESALFAHVEEAVFAGDPRLRGKLFHMITSPDVTIERKGVEPFTVDSFVRILMSTNSDWAVPAGATARRFAVFDVSSHRMGDLAYFHALHDEIDGDGAGAYLAYLMGLDLRGFDVRKIPQTKALNDQKRHSVGSVEAWWAHEIQTEELWEDGPALELKRRVYDRYERFATARRQYPQSYQVFAETMSAMCPGARTTRLRKDGRLPSWAFPSPAECRRDYDRHIGVVPKRRSLAELLG